MKRRLLLIVTLIMTISILQVACSKDKQSTQTDDPAVSAGKAEEGKIDDAKNNSDDNQQVNTNASEPGSEPFTPGENEDFVGPTNEAEGKDKNDHPIIKAIDFSLRDQNGKRWSLTDLKGKTVILNFWQTWCPPCRQEMPDFQKTFEELGENKEDVIILGVQSPSNEMNTVYTSEKEDADGIAKFLTDNGYTYPTLMDYKAELFINYGIQSFPTTYFINKDGYLYGMVPGFLDAKTLNKLIEETKNFQIEN